jgi:hypothetical protein
VTSSGDETSRESATSALRGLMRAIGIIHNRNDPSRAVGSVALIRCTIPRQQRNTPQSCEELLRVEL